MRAPVKPTTGRPGRQPDARTSVTLAARPAALSVSLVQRQERIGGLVHDEPTPLLAFCDGERLVSLARPHSLVDVDDSWQLGHGYVLTADAVAAVRALARQARGHASYRRRPGPLAA